MSATDPVLPAPVIDSTADAERSTGTASPLKITVPGYADFTAGDTVTLYWDGTAVSGGEYIVPDGEGDQPITFTIPTRAIADTPSGTLHVTYRVTDRAGNVSSPSESTQA